MEASLLKFEEVCRRSGLFVKLTEEHAFDRHEIHDTIRAVALGLFDNGHFAQATFEAYKFLEATIQSLSGQQKTGFELMMTAFGGSSPSIKLNNLLDANDLSEQDGYKHFFAGVMRAIRNPRGHGYALKDDPETCLDHLSIVSALIRRLELAGYRVAK